MLKSLSKKEREYILLRLERITQTQIVEIGQDREKHKHKREYLMVYPNYDSERLEERIKVRQRMLRNLNSMKKVMGDFPNDASFNTLRDRDRIHRELVSDLKNLI